MRWHEITIHTTEQATEMVSNFLHELEADGVSIEESGTLNKKRDTSLGQFYESPLNDIPEGFAVVKGYFLETEDPAALMAGLEPRIAELRDFGIDPGSGAMETRLVDEDDWANAWKQYFKPIRVTDKLTIKPTWEVYTPESAEERIIELDPGMAFGTGTHPTTSLCLRTLESVIEGGEDIIDVGTGSGILAIGACLLGAKWVLAVDLDPVAVASAAENVELNGLSDRINVRESDLLQVLHDNDQSDNAEGILGVKLPVRIVVANILAEVIMLFIDDVYQVLEAGGYYITSGIYKNKEQAVEQALTASGFTIVDRQRDQDWIAFVAKKQ